MEAVLLQHGKAPNTQCSVLLLGATIDSWQVFGNEMLFVSKLARVEEHKTALRGGIPLVFPQFGPGPIKQHGFARLTKWELVGGPAVDPGTGDVTAELALRPNDFTRAMWDHDFQLTYRVMLKDTSLAVQLAVTNTGKAPFSFTALLHTYLPVSAIAKTTVSGLTGCEFIDKVDGSQRKVEQGAPVTIDGETDRVYCDVPGDVCVGDGGNAEILIKRTNFKDIVLWNPWADKAKAMKDFEDAEYERMVCVEAGVVTAPVELAPGETWEGKQGLSIKMLDAAL